MADQHPGPDLGLIAQTLLAALDPLLQAAASVASPPDSEPGICQQVWCPVCALLAVTRGEQHPLVGIVAEHGAALLQVLRDMARPHGGPPARPAERSASPANAPGRYQSIPVTVHE